jgi:hypothetical protein
VAGVEGDKRQTLRGLLPSTAAWLGHEVCRMSC